MKMVKDARDNVVKFVSDFEEKSNDYFEVIENHIEKTEEVLEKVKDIVESLETKPVKKSATKSTTKSTKKRKLESAPIEIEQDIE